MGRNKLPILGGLIIVLLYTRLASSEQGWTSIEKLISDDWYGVYFDGKKVRFLNLSFKPIEMDGNKAFESRLDERIVFFFNDKKHPAQRTISSIFSASEPWERMAGNYKSQGPHGEIETIGEKLSEDTYIVSTSFQRKEEERHVPKSKATIMDMFSINNDCIQGVKAGQKGQYRSWNCEKQKDENYYYEFTKIEQQKSQTGNTKLVNVRISNPEGDVTEALYEIGTGRLVEMTYESGIILKRESKEEASDDSKIHCLIMNDYIETDKPLETSDDEKIKSCTLLLPNIRTEDVPENSRTTTKATKEGAEVRVIGETFNSNEKVVKSDIPDDIKEFLKESKGCSSSAKVAVGKSGGLGDTLGWLRGQIEVFSG